MAKTILQLWSDTFGDTMPDNNREATSAMSVPTGGSPGVRNPLSTSAKAANLWTSDNQLPQGRASSRIGHLYNAFFSEGWGAESGPWLTDSDATLMAGVEGNATVQDTTQWAADGKGPASDYQSMVYMQGNFVRWSGPDVFKAFHTGQYKGVNYLAMPSDRGGGQFAAFFAAVDDHTQMSEADNSFKRNNYRLGAADPNGPWANFTSYAGADQAMTGRNGTVEDQDTTALGATV